MEQRCILKNKMPSILLYGGHSVFRNALPPIFNKKYGGVTLSNAHGMWALLK